MSSFTKKEIVSNFSWRYIGKLGTQVLSFILTLVLARLIAPEAFGAVAIVGIFITFLEVFVDSGLGNALVQKENVDEIDFSSVFFFNIVVCLVLYVVLFLAAPLVADFYNNQLLCPLLRIASLSLIITGLRNTQETYVIRNLLFQKHFVAITTASLVSSSLAVFLAYKGFEAWAIVLQQLMNVGLSTLLLWFLIPWRPHFLFSFHRLKGLISYGWKILGANLIDTTYTEIRSLFIGKVYTAKDLAYYNQGKTFPYMIVSGLNSAINSVLFPVMSRNQDDNQALKSILRKTIRISMYFVSSILAYLFCCSEAMVEVLITEKWLSCVVYMQILCFDALFWPLMTAHYNSYKAIGRSDIYLRSVTITKLLGILLLIIVIPYGVIWVAVSSVLAMLIQYTIVSVISRKINSYCFKEQVLDLIKALTSAFLILICTYFIQYLPISPLAIFLIQTVISGIVFYIYGKVSKNEGFTLLNDLINKLIKK